MTIGFVVAIKQGQPIIGRWNCKKINIKVSFFWDQSQDMGDFPPKNQASDWLTYQVYQLEASFFGGKSLELMYWLGPQKKLTLVIILSIRKDLNFVGNTNFFDKIGNTS